MGSRLPPPGFQGLHPYKPLTRYVRHLPHWRQDGATYFVTFRLSDSLPHEKLEELKQVRRDWERRHRSEDQQASDQQFEELVRELMRRVERWLDLGMGSCRLKDAVAARSVVMAMHYFDEQRYELNCYVVMPNHVHVLLRPLHSEEEPLERILQSWKRHTARQINHHFGLEGQLWQEESFDRIVRDEEHLERAIRYIGDNPSRAGLTETQCPRWIRPEWETLGWGFYP